MSEEHTPKFLIITSETGGGHTSAASAIADGLKRFAAPECLVNIVRAIEDSHLLVEKLVGFYNYLLRHHQHLMKYHYWFIKRFRPMRRACFTGCIAIRRQLFESWCPHVVVRCTH